jgi:putative nucleotidyltransferase with HDIG domain
LTKTGTTFFLVVDTKGGNMLQQTNLALFVTRKEIINKIKNIADSTHLKLEITILRSFAYLDEKEKKKIDYVIVDQDIDGQNFLDILNHLKSHYPSVVRILIVEKWTQELIIMSNQLMHIVLEKKTIENELPSMLIKADKMRSLLTDSELVKMVNSFDSLPVFKTLYLEILHLLKRTDASLKKIGDLVESDIVLSAKILQIVNMSVYATSGRINSVVSAVIYLGVNILRALIVSIQVFNLNSGNQNLAKHQHTLEKHSMKVAECSRTLAQSLKVDRAIADDSFTSGLLHDIGKIVMLGKIHNWNDLYETAKEQNQQLYMIEEKVLKTSHSKIGAYLLGIWGFSIEVLDAVAFHHTPSKLPAKKVVSALTFVHVAEAMIENEKYVDEDTFLDRLDIDYISDLGIRHQIMAAYKELCSKTDQKTTTNSDTDSDK